MLLLYRTIQNGETEGKTMRKTLCILLAFMLLLAAAPATAQEEDLTNYSDKQLQEALENGEKLLKELQNSVQLIEDTIGRIKAEQDRRSGKAGGTAAAGGFSHTPVTIKQSPDKYTWYIQDYVGRNAASIGYTSLGGDRLERCGAGVLKFIFVTEDGAYLDDEDESVLKQYIVTDQNLKPNTEMKMTFQKDSRGKEYDNLVEYQSIESIDLKVRRLDGKTSGETVKAEMIAIKASPDRHTWYMRNYVGRNVASFGYNSWGGDRMDEYGAGHIKLILIADDGAYLDPHDAEQLKQYVVTRQDIAPNTEIRLTFMTDSKGNEYANLVRSQNYESITLYAHRLRHGK